MNQFDLSSRAPQKARQTSRRRRRFGISPGWRVSGRGGLGLVAAVAAVGSLVACSASPGTDATSAASATEATQAVDPTPDQAGESSAPPEQAPSATSPGTVRLVTYDSFAMSDELKAAFEAETGLTLEILPSGSAGVVVNQAILTKDNPIGDVLFGVDSTFGSRAVQEGIFAPYTSAVAVAEQARYAFDESASLVPIDYSDVCINVDHAWFIDNDLAEPTTLADLAFDPYPSLLVVENPATSSTGLAFLLATIGAFGDQNLSAQADDVLPVADWRDYWTRLAAGGVKVTEGWSDAYYVDFSGPSSEGDRPLVVSYASSPPSEIPDGADQPQTGTLTQTCFRQTEYAGILAGAANPTGAAQLIDFLLSPAFQTELPGQMWMFPVNSSVPLPEDWAAFATLPDKPFTVPADQIATNREAWITDWTDIVLG